MISQWRVKKMNAKRKLTWMLAFAAVIAVLPVIWTLAQAQTGAGSGSQAPAEAPQFTNDLPRTPPSPAQVEEQLAATATGSAFLVLPPAAFSSDGYDPDGFYNGNQGYLNGKVDSGACLVAPVQLPDGVTISSFEVRLKDNNANLYEWFDLFRTNLATGATDTLATVSSPAGSTWTLVVLVDDTVNSPVVSDMYAYSVVTCVRPSIYVYSVRIGYSSTVYMPLVPNTSH